MYIYAFYIFTIEISTKMLSLIYNKTFSSLLFS